MKNIKSLAAGAALFTLCITGCTKELENTGVPTGKQVTMTMQASGDQTRADYTPGDGNAMAFSWRSNDSISVVVNGVSGNENCELKTVKEGKSAPFSGIVTTWNGSKNIYAFYPYSTTGYTVTGGDNSASATAVLTLPSTQTYTIGGAISNSFMVGTGTATATAEGVNASASMMQVMSIIKLNITNAPAAVTGVRLIGPGYIFPTKATVKLSDATISSPEGMTNQLSMTVTDTTAATTKAVSFAMFPANLSGKEIWIEVSFANGETRNLIKTGKDFKRNVHYIMDFDAAEATKWSSMSFTIATTDNKIVLPFNTDKALTRDYTLDIDWGDGGSKTILASTIQFYSALLTHTYATNGTYSITIRSSQTNNTKAQVPGFKPGSYNYENNNKKFISIDTPLLNTGEVDFTSCFIGCAGLTSIPAGLFDNNLQVTTFTDCFSSCIGLTGSIPEGLFAKNLGATGFYGCFSGCTKLKLNANIFCDETTDKTTRFADKTVDFSQCFYNVGSDASVKANAGTAPALWDYTFGATPTSFRCYYSIGTVTNATAIPATGWK